MTTMDDLAFEYLLNKQEPGTVLKVVNVPVDEGALWHSVFIKVASDKWREVDVAQTRKRITVTSRIVSLACGSGVWNLS